MCGRYTFISIDQLFGRFNVVIDDFQPRYNVAPTQSMPVVVRKHNQNQLVLMKWGLIPHWAKEARIGSSMINARAETLAEKPAFRSLIKSKRCLIPADGFYEWKTEGKSKLPYYIGLKDHSLFTFAGLYDSWQDAQNNTIHSYTIITIAANALISPLHDRMPVILSTENENAWLNEENVDFSRLKDYLQTYPAEEMMMNPVSQAVNSPKNDSRELIMPG